MVCTAQVVKAYGREHVLGSLSPVCLMLAVAAHKVVRIATKQLRCEGSV